MGNKKERQERQDRLAKKTGTYILSKYIGPWMKQLCIPVILIVRISLIILILKTSENSLVNLNLHVIVLIIILYI